MGLEAEAVMAQIGRRGIGKGVGARARRFLVDLLESKLRAAAWPKPGRVLA